jgi:hypothetical protein
MKSLVALLALLAFLAVPFATGASDDHYAREVKARFGAPSSREIVSCGTDASGWAAYCLRWQYDTGATRAVFFFEPGTERLIEVFTWDEGIRDATDASEQVHALLQAARNVSEQ